MQDVLVMAICSSTDQTLRLLVYTCKSAAEKHFGCKSDHAQISEAINY